MQRAVRSPKVGAAAVHEVFRAAITGVRTATMLAVSRRAPPPMAAQANSPPSMAWFPGRSASWFARSNRGCRRCGGEGQPAPRTTGSRSGDVVLSCNGEAVVSSRQFNRLVLDSHAGQPGPAATAARRRSPHARSARRATRSYRPGSRRRCVVQSRCTTRLASRGVPRPPTPLHSSVSERKRCGYPTEAASGTWVPESSTVAVPRKASPYSRLTAFGPRLGCAPLQTAAAEGFVPGWPRG